MEETIQIKKNVHVVENPTMWLQIVEKDEVMLPKNNSHEVILNNNHSQVCKKEGERVQHNYNEVRKPKL